MIATILSGLGRCFASHARALAVCAISVSALACAHAQSDIVWNFNSATPSGGLPSDVTGGTVTQGNNNGTTTMLVNNAVSGYTGASGTFNAGLAARIGAYSSATSAYFQFELTPAAGKTLTISAIQFGSRSTGTGPQAYAVYTSVNNFASSVASGTIPNNSVWNLYTPSFTAVTSPSGATVTVRIFGFNGAGSPAINVANWRIDDLKVTVSTAGGTVQGTAPFVASMSPAGGASAVAVDAPVAITFDQPVNVAPGWFTISGSTSGAIAANVTGGPTSFTLTPTTAFANGETVTVTLSRAFITEQTTGLLKPVADTQFSFSTVAAGSITPIHDIQGAGETSTFAGQDVTIRGVVVGTFPGLGGFFVQEEDADADANPATSEGIFVFDAANTPVSVGSLVTVTGRVTEYFGLTELGSPVAVSVSGTAPLPAASPVSLPVANLTDLERYEGMRVTFPQTLFVTETFLLGRYGEVPLSSGGILPIPTNVAAPGAPALAQMALNERNRIVLDDGRTTQNPDPTPFLFGPTEQEKTLRVGDTVTGLSGVLTYQFDAYTVQAVTAPTFVRANPRTPPSAAVGNVRVASANVLNFFNGNGAGGGFPTSRGADDTTEFARQRAHLVASLLATNADIIGLIEIENDGFGSTSAIRDLVNGLNAMLPAGAGYEIVDLGGPIGTDEITCGFIYKPSRVTRVGNAAVNFSATFNRPPIAQTFAALNGPTFTVCVNHFKSKGSAPSSGPNIDQGDGQGAWNALRVEQANALAAWLATHPTGTTDSDRLIIGDLNAYAKEDPITALRGAGYVNVLETFEGVGGYSYVFDGEAGHLDHALASPSLVPQVLAAATWHNNSPEPIVLDYNLEFKSAAQHAINNGPLNDGNTPWRASDHDPVLVDLQLSVPGSIITGTAGRDTLTGTLGDDTITGGAAADTLTGGAGRDRFVYQNMRDAVDIINDFVPGTDTLVLTELLSSINVPAAQALSAGYIRVIDVAGGCSLQIDADGTAGAGVARTLVTLKSVSAAQLNLARDLAL